MGGKIKNHTKIELSNKAYAIIYQMIITYLINKINTKTQINLSLESEDLA